jgi:Arc/MetJ-type ribon-helix-helix transcriptional regulator
MAETKQMTITFPEPMAEQLRAAVEAGEYASTSEAVCDAVRCGAITVSRTSRDYAALGMRVKPADRPAR